MYKIVVVFIVVFIFTCCASRKYINKSSTNWEADKLNIEPVFTIEEYCTYCMGEGESAAIVRLKEVTYKLQNRVNEHIVVRDKMRELLKDWIAMRGMEYSLNHFSRWYGFRIIEYAPYNLSMRVIDDIYRGDLTPESLDVIHSNLVEVGKSIYKVSCQKKQLYELAQRVDTYAVPPHGICGVCVYEDHKRSRKEELSANYR